jgi:hypothetical protein
MARRRLTLEAQLKGVRAALRSRRTPRQFLDGLRRQESKLERRIAAQAARAGRAREAG